MCTPFPEFIMASTCKSEDSSKYEKEENDDDDDDSTDTDDVNTSSVQVSFEQIGIKIQIKPE